MLHVFRQLNFHCEIHLKLREPRFLRADFLHPEEITFRNSRSVCQQSSSNGHGKAEKILGATLAMRITVTKKCFDFQDLEQPSSMVFVQASELFPKKTLASGLFNT